MENLKEITYIDSQSNLKTLWKESGHWVKKYPYSELFWSTFSGIRAEYGEIRSSSSYSVRMWKNVDQNNSKYRHFYAVGTSKRLVKKMFIFTTITYVWSGFKDVSRSPANILQQELTKFRCSLLESWIHKPPQITFAFYC